MDTPDKIAATLKTDTSIRIAQKNPGLKNYHKVLKYAISNITKPFPILLFSIFIFTTYSTAIIIFCGSFVTAAAALILLAGSIFEALKIPGKYTAEIIGTIGSGLFAAMLCLLIAYGLFKLFRLFIKISTGIVGRMFKKTRSPIPKNERSPAEKTRSSRLFVKICAGTAAACLILAIATGLPVKLFMIFNSMEPLNIENRTWEYNAAEVRNLNINSAHSHIRLVKSSSDRIKIEYEQPDWMEAKADLNSGLLTFDEKSNGRLPIFFLISLHENKTYVTISLPEGFEPDNLNLESRGGFVHIESTDYNALVKTYTGNIYLEPGSDAFPYNLKAMTSTGLIQKNGKSVGTKSQNALKYNMSSNNGSSLELETSRGSIFVTD